MRHKDDEYGILRPKDVVIADVYCRVGRIAFEVTGREPFRSGDREEPGVRLIRPGYRLSTVVPVAVVAGEGYFWASQDDLVKFVSFGKTAAQELQKPTWRRALEVVKRQTTRIRSKLRGF